MKNLAFCSIKARSLDQRWIFYDVLKISEQLQGVRGMAFFSTFQLLLEQSIGLVRQPPGKVIPTSQRISPSLTP